MWILNIEAQNTLRLLIERGHSNPWMQQVPFKPGFEVLWRRASEIYCKWKRENSPPPKSEKRKHLKIEKCLVRLLFLLCVFIPAVTRDFFFVIALKWLNVTGLFQVFFFFTTSLFGLQSFLDEDIPARWCYRVHEGQHKLRKEKGCKPLNM